MLNWPAANRSEVGSSMRPARVSPLDRYDEGALLIVREKIYGQVRDPVLDALELDRSTAQRAFATRLRPDQLPWKKAARQLPGL